MALGPLHYIRYLLLLLISWVTQGYSQNLSFQPGTSYGYYYTLDLELKHISQPSMPGTKLNIKANIQTYLLWKNKVQTDDQLVLVQIQDFAIQRSKCNNTKDSYVIEEFGDIVNGSSFGRPVLFHWKSGKILALYGAGEDNSQILDLKRGLVSLFQFQPLTGNQTEDDISGRCLVTYQTSENLITKTKDLSSCRNLPFGFQDGNMFGVFLNSSSKSKLAHDGGVIQMAVTEESHIVSLYVKSLLGSQITSRQQLQLISSIPGSAEIPGDSVHSIVDGLPEKYHKIEIASHPQRRSQGNQLLSQYLKTSKTKSSKLDISKISTNKDFIAFVRMFRQAKKKDVLQLLKTASKELVPFYIDAAVAAQSPASLSALSEFLDFSKKKQSNLHEKFLYSAAFAPHPSNELLNLVLGKLKGKVVDPVIMETGIIIIGAIIGKMCKIKLCHLKDVELAKATLVEGLLEAEEETEKKLYFIALENAQLEETVPFILQYAEENNGYITQKALAALQGFPMEFISTKDVQNILKRIFHQTFQEYDISSRLKAAELLLATELSQMDLINIILGLEHINTQASKLIISKIQNRHQVKHLFMKREANVLKDKYLHNYSRISKLDRSTFYSGTLTATKDMVSTYGLDLLFTESGLLKRSVSDITLFGNNHHHKAMQVSIETDGLESLLGDAAEEEEEKDATVGMSAVLFEVQLRPVVFFQGYMDLMSKVFSSSGDPLTVVKGNVLLIDYLQRLPMQSGLQAICEYQGALGLEMSANIDVSIWEQESKININTKTGLVFEYTMEVDTYFFQADIKAQADAETTVDFDSVMKLSGPPMLMCLELRHNNIPYRETYILSESFPKNNITYKKRKGRKATLWGSDFPFHQSNSQMCRSLLTAEEQ